LLSILTDAGLGLVERLATPWRRKRLRPGPVDAVTLDDEMAMPFELDPEDARTAEPASA
jgi:hypothetical protein